jgi:hypothetical protein
VETVGVFELDPVALQQQIKAKKVILLRCDVRCHCNCNHVILKVWMMQKKVQEAEEEAIAC